MLGITRIVYEKKVFNFSFFNFLYPTKILGLC
jgi:hypothetical protein